MTDEIIVSYAVGLISGLLIGLLAAWAIMAKPKPRSGK